MTVLYQNLTLAFDTNEAKLPQKLAEKLRISPRRIREVSVVRRSLDSRRGRPPRYVYLLEVELDPEVERALLARKNPPVRPAKPPESLSPPPLTSPPTRRPVVVGSGPAGLFAAWRLTMAGTRPLVIERGPEVKTRSLRWADFLRGGEFDQEANLLFGEGGAGTYSDGKLYSRVNDPRGDEVIRILVEHGNAPKEILTDARPHIGSNRLPAVQRRLREHLIREGAEFSFETLATGLVTDGASPGRSPAVRGIHLRNLTSGEASTLETDAVFLAPGHSARDTFDWLREAGVEMERKPFQIGVRIEHPQEWINQVQYGSSAGHPKLPPAEYHWVADGQGSDVFSFCMCPGGEILPATEQPGSICTNGASRHRRTSPYANSGFVITVEPEQFGLGDDPFAGVELQSRIERKAAEAAGGPFGTPALRISDLLQGRRSRSLPESSYPLPLTVTDFETFFPSFILDPIRAGLGRLAERIPGFADDCGLVVAPESRSSSPLRILRDRNRYTSPSLDGLHPIGEGAGYAGGILSAAIDGMHAAEAWIARMREAVK